MSAGRSHRRQVRRGWLTPPKACEPLPNDLGTLYSCVPGWAASYVDLPQARQQTHDVLLRLMGDERRGGVQWRWWQREEAWEALGQLAALRDDSPPDGLAAQLPAVYAQIAQRLEAQGGYFVVAFAPGVPAEEAS